MYHVAWDSHRNSNMGSFLRLGTFDIFREVPFGSTEDDWRHPTIPVEDVSHTRHGLILGIVTEVDDHFGRVGKYVAGVVVVPQNLYQCDVMIGRRQWTPFRELFFKT